MTDTTTTRVRKGGPNAIFGLVAVASTAALLPYLNKSVWRDESASLYSARLNWTSLWHESLVVDRVLLPYYAFLHLWLDVSYNIGWARIPSLLAYGLIIYSVGVLARRVAGFWCGLVAAGLACTNPLLITSALDARPYELAALASVLSVAALLRWFDRGEILFVWLFCAMAIATATLQLFSVLAPLSALGACILVRPRSVCRNWRSLLAPIAVLAVIVVVFLALVAHQTGQVAWIPGLGPKLFIGDMEGPASTAAGHLVYPVIVTAIALVSLALCLFAVRKQSFRSSRFELDRFAVYLSMAAIPTVVLVFITAIKPVYVDRYVTASVPAMAVAVALLASYAFRTLGATTSNLRQIFVVGTALVCVGIFISNAAVVSKAPLVDNLKGAAQYISRESHSASEIAVPSHFLTGGVEYYLHRDGSSSELWPQKFGPQFNAEFVLNENDSAFENAPSSVWLVNDNTVTGTKKFISRLRGHGFTQVSSKSFDGVKVLHFLRHPSS